MHRVLKVDRAGTPQDWLTAEDAACEIYSKQVAWTLGPVIRKLRGGWNRQGNQFVMEIPAIIGSTGQAPINLAACVPPLGRHNSKLFERDLYLCAYCGQRPGRDHLTRDHVLPLSRRGKDEWTNVVTACGRCNRHKSNKTPEEAGMPLLYVPYAPNWFEDFILGQGQRHILADQMQFLMARLPSHSRILKQ